MVIVDECQNLNLHELDTIITRLGHNSRIIFCGDYAQSDLLYNKNDQSGLPEFLKVTDRMASFKTVKFCAEDIVRSGVVREYILAKNALEIEAANRKKAREQGEHDTE